MNETSDIRRELREGVKAAKEKKWMGELYLRLADMHKEGSMDPSLLTDFGWLIYYQLRQTLPNNVLQFKRMLLQYLKLGLESPSLLHSLILSEAIKLKKASPSQFHIKEFSEMWGLDHFREEDWAKFKPENGHVLNSLVENLIGTYAKELKTERKPASDEFAALVDRAIKAYPSNPHLPLCKAIVLESQDKKEEALTHYKTLLRRWPKKFYLWGMAERMLPVQDIDTRMAYLAKAITLVRGQNFLGDLRLRMANLLIRKGMYAHAKYELEQYKKYYFSQGWRIKRWCETLEQRLRTAFPAFSSLSAEPTPYDPLLRLADSTLRP